MAKKTKGKQAKYHKVEKSAGSYSEQTAYTNDYNKSPISGITSKNKRGIGIYSASQLIAEVGVNDKGYRNVVSMEQPYFFLTVMQRIELSKLCSEVFSIVTSRMNRVSSLDFQINPIKKEEDRIVEGLKNYYQIYQERKDLTDMQSLTIKGTCYVRIMDELPDILPDLSNFSQSLARWKKRITFKRADDSQEITDWLMEPNQGTSWGDYAKKWVYDQLIHGATATYKQCINGRPENFDVLPGGTVYRFKEKYFSAVNGYAQLIPGEEYQIMFSNELSYSEYLPISAQSHPIIPMEALINKLTETLLFDKLMSDQADGTKPPEKLVLVTNNQSPFSDFDHPTEVALDVNEQKRIEMKLNTPRKFAVATMTGNSAEILDLTRENTMATQMERQKQVRECIGLVFLASNIELNLTGTTSMGGRETGRIQQEISTGRGLGPQLIQLARQTTKDIIMHRYGYGYRLEYADTMDPTEQAQLDMLQLQTGEVTVNEIRERQNKSLFPDPQYDKPQGGSNQQPPDGSQTKPFNFKGIGGQ